MKPVAEAENCSRSLCKLLYKPEDCSLYSPALSSENVYIGSYRELSPVGSECRGDKKMPKQKTHKGMKRRFKITASGKATHRKSSRGHLLSHKSAKRKRNLRNGGLVCGAEAKLLIDALRPGA